MYEWPLSFVSQAPLMWSVILSTSISTVLRHRFGLYGRTRMRLSTSKMGPVPSALIRQTGFFKAMRMPNEAPPQTDEM